VTVFDDELRAFIADLGRPGRRVRRRSASPAAGRSPPAYRHRRLLDDAQPCRTRPSHPGEPRDHRVDGYEMDAKAASPSPITRATSSAPPASRSGRRTLRQPARARDGGFEARAVQHELDHLDGLLFIDRVVSRRTDLFRRKVYQKGVVTHALRRVSVGWRLAPAGRQRTAPRH